MYVEDLLEESVPFNFLDWGVTRMRFAPNHLIEICILTELSLE
jgi:hypothetical protein